MIILLTWIAVFIALIALYYRGVNSRYKKYGVKYNTPIPLVGNMMSIVLRSEHMADNMVTFYNEFPEERFTARFEFLNEVVVIRDLDLIKQIGVKDFEYFLDHRPMFGETNSFFARTIFALKGRLTHEVDAETDLDTGFATVKESKVGTKEVTRIWAEEDLVAQAVLFFIAGFEGISSVMCFLFYELAVNPDVQDLLAQEIREHDAKNNGRFDFNSIQNMTYLDMVTSELLRKWTPGAFLDRVCNKDYNLGKPNKDATEDFIIRKGTGIAIPTFAIHRDPQYFPDPLKFDPERFSEENKHKIQPFTYMPFGVGPRNCVGSRFALCELKAIVYQILLHLELSPSVKTVIPAKLLPSESFNFRMVGGHHLRFKIRP